MTKPLPCALQERCRELEAELADLNLDLQELTTALAKVEADAAASADEKQVLRQEYEGKIEAVVKQMAGLQQQMKQQVGPKIVQLLSSALCPTDTVVMTHNSHLAAECIYHASKQHFNEGCARLGWMPASLHFSQSPLLPCRTVFG